MDEKLGDLLNTKVPDREGFVNEDSTLVEQRVVIGAKAEDILNYIRT